MDRGNEDVRRVLAKWQGYFWLPCPMCKRMFSGSETGRHSIPYIDSPGTSAICCKWCDDHPEAEHIIAQGYTTVQRDEVFRLHPQW